MPVESPARITVNEEMHSKPDRQRLSDEQSLWSFNDQPTRYDDPAQAHGDAFTRLCQREPPMTTRFPLTASCRRTLVTRLTIAACLFSTHATRADEPALQESTSALIQRDQVRLTLAGAEIAIAAARQQAKAMELEVNITVVDDGGHPLAFVRMDGARPASAYTSMTKATSAATKRAATGPLGPEQMTDTQLSLAVENAAASSGGKFTTLKGGLPIVIDGQVIGAIGVGGATGEQDTEIAQAGVDALMKATGSSHVSNPQVGSSDSRDVASTDVPGGKGIAILRTSAGGYLLYPISNRVQPLEAALQSGTQVESLLALRAIVDDLRGSVALVEGQLDSIADANGALTQLTDDDRKQLQLGN